ncbi:MAG: hypothetical protein COA99_11480 [Moraxellaceae bacterium]|nr:MAG: hypothetical protein COA99_11480 [Moraxellaceae bacterium]
MEVPFKNKIGSAGFRAYTQLKGYEFKIAVDKEDVSRANELRNRIFSDEKYSDDLANLHEQQDKFTTIFICHYKGELVGTIRLVELSKCSALSLFNVELPDSICNNNAKELGGLAVETTHRGVGRIALMGLIDTAYKFSLTNNIHWWLCSSRGNQYKSFKAINEDCQKLEQHQPDQLQLETRKIFASWFEKYGGDLVVFVFDLSGVSYFKNIQTIIKSKFRYGAKTPSRPNTESLDAK